MEHAMPRLSDQLSRELIERGNLPVSEKGIVKLRPDLAHDLDAARSLLDDGNKHSQLASGEQQADHDLEDVLLAEFTSEAEGELHGHLFLLETPDGVDQGERLKRWSKSPVSYGSFVQVRKFLKDAWGEVRNLEIRRVRLRPGQKP